MNTHSIYCFQKYGTLSISYYQLPTLSVSLQFLLSVAQNKPDSEHFSSDCIPTNCHSVSVKLSAMVLAVCACDNCFVNSQMAAFMINTFETHIHVCNIL